MTTATKSQDVSRTDAAPTLLTRRAVVARTALSESGLKRAMARDGFPRPVTIGQRRVAWIASEVDAWIKSKISAARGGANA